MKLQTMSFTSGGKCICDNTVTIKPFCAVFTIAAFLWVSPSLATTIPYNLNGTLEDGGQFMGTFTLSTKAVDLAPSTSIGLFDLEKVNIQLVNTNLFMSGPSTATSGSASSARLFQTSSQQDLLINFTSDDGLSGVFVDGLSFAPFVGDPNIPSPIQGNWTMGGFFDGAGNVSISPALN